MRLYKGNAEKMVGKKIDRHRRMFGRYPMEVVETNGELYVIDTDGVRMPIPEKETDFNCFVFDFVID
jgi:hypothetical protein